MTRSPGSEQQVEIVGALRGADAPLSTTDVREIINRGRPEPLVCEQLYRRLLALQRHGLVERVNVARDRNVYWRAASHACREVS
ncbi:MAG TPA: hypothetical protein VMU34_13330 [Mycobacterium sp.]|nr:hypothetical protein [Mycobacterium sp.]